MVINELQIFDWTDRRVLVSCSGGADSMVLLAGLLQIGVRPEVFHVNYQLRGADSDADAAFVRQVCEQHQLVFHYRIVNGADFKRRGVNLQNEARKVRRDFFGSWNAQGADHVVALAHHADDQEETFFLHYLRGAGIVGLGAIHPQREQIWRPFLRLPKSVLISWANQQKIEWREDQSNATTIYARNRLRNELLPALHAELPQLRESVLLLSECFRREAASIEQQLEELFRDWQQRSELGVIVWKSMSRAEQEVFLNRIGVSTGAVAELSRLAGMPRGKQLMIGKHCFYRTRNVIALQTQPPHYELKVVPVNALPSEFSPDAIYLDKEKISGELRLRSWETEDYIEPVGMNGKIPVEKALKDAGISRQERMNFPVLSDNEAVLWIPGLRVSRRKLASNASASVVKVTVSSARARVRF